MKKLYILFLASFCAFLWFSSADSSITNPSYSIRWDDIRIYRTDNSKWWYMDINLKDPNTNDRLHFGEVKMSDQVFTFTKQWEWDQNIQIVPWDGWDVIQFTVEFEWKSDTKINKDSTSSNPTENKTAANRTVISAVPKTGPSGSLIWIILATLAIFGGYIYIKKRAAI